MQLSLVLLIAAPLLAFAAERDPRVAEDLMAREEPFALDKRACKANGCKCKSGYAGVYCANCPSGGGWVVSKLGSGGSTSHVYQCDGSGGCCDYGKANDCAGGATGRCG